MTRFLNRVRLFPDLLKSLKASPFSKNYGSVLFVPGNKATETFAYLIPHLDFDKRFKDLDRLKRELTLRGMKVDPQEIKETWEFYKYIDANRWTLENRRSEVSNRIENLKKKTELTQEEEKEMIALKTQAKVLKQDLKIVKDALWDLEDTVVVRALKLPNELDDQTPEEAPVVLEIVGEPPNPPEKERKSHLDIGKSLGVLEYKNPLNYYLCNEAAFFELGALGFCGEILGENMIRVAGSDFSRSIIVEGTGLDHEDFRESFILTDVEADKNPSSRIHLVGGASLMSFLAMHTKQLINPKNFPLRYFTTGRQYTPFPDDLVPVGLFTVCQSSAAHAFAMVTVPGSDEYKVEFEKLLQKVTNIYDNIGIHYRIVMRPAFELRPWESLRVSIELWSSFSQQYVEVGFVSTCGDFLSKRLLIAYQTKDGRNFPAVISGTVLSVPRLLACLLEQNPKRFEIPECIKKCMPGGGI